MNRRTLLATAIACLAKSTSGQQLSPLRTFKGVQCDLQIVGDADGHVIPIVTSHMEEPTVALVSIFYSVSVNFDKKPVTLLLSRMSVVRGIQTGLACMGDSVDVPDPQAINMIRVRLLKDVAKETEFKLETPTARDASPASATAPQTQNSRVSGQQKEQ